ncbi:hypothetical protein B1J93_06855 [Leptospira kirschneri serovar Pomona]|uniref:Uncharacterized protein n=1 Tax=Leptospira kirschneri serovar Pomona TaxID=561005 RepID=A0A1T1DTG4_9LEPT|nr:hypothetical protein B1J93_06855 [Leptospira kirschneri serovar Pomona]
MFALNFCLAYHKNEKTILFSFYKFILSLLLPLILIKLSILNFYRDFIQNNKAEETVVIFLIEFAKQ